MRTRLTQFLTDRRASVTVEFVIIFPLVILLILFILSTSKLIATASDVQQLAYELARESVDVSARMVGTGDICSELNKRVSTLARQTAMLNPANIKPQPTCTTNSGGYLTVTVVYNLAGNTIADVGEQLDMSTLGGTIQRSATIRP